ncbi:hypothetical protein N0V84_000983 [Fusarium piperis]|uniref:BTB domain-containing protein n=1 Tax=Fusarium piperis TaxID=1435070 RepID=A0A9W9BT29_9HYPO|nr:hypothetical protein N0V84_000983 [Fusarium piperis]
MDSSNIHQIVSSPMAQFRIGPNQAEFSINSELIAVQSPSLGNIIRHHEGRFDDRPILWKHVDVNTFICFSEFAFTGDYNGVEPRPRQVPPAIISQPSPVPKTTKLRLASSAGDPVCGYSSFLWNNFAARYPGHEFSQHDAVDSRTHTCADVFLCHARVFIFADRYRVTSLRDLAIRKLWIAMVNMTFTGNAIPDITELAKYVYKSTTRESPAGKEIRNLVRRYIIMRLKRMSSNSEFRDFACNSELLDAIN